MIHDVDFQKELSKYISEKVKTLWPSGSGNNPMTEANLLLSVQELLYAKGYVNFMEVPFYAEGSDSITGRFDGISIKDGTMIIMEAKSDKPGWDLEVHSDFMRMEKYKEGYLPYLYAKPIQNVFIYSIHWTEDSRKASVFQKIKVGDFSDPFSALNSEGLLAESTEVHFDSAFYKNSYWINLLGRKIL